MNKIIILIIIFYQKYISNLKLPCCRFIPTCSEYAIGVVEKYGISKGIIMIIKRIIKCNYFTVGGYDPY